MGKALCKEHGSQVVAFVSSFHQDKIAKGESSKAEEIRYIEVIGINRMKNGRYLIDAGVLTELGLADSPVSSVLFSSPSYEKLALDLRAVCPICLFDYLGENCA